MQTSQPGIFVLSGLGAMAEHVVAAAIALRHFPGAEVAFSSMRALPDVLSGRAAAGPLSEVHLVGIGLQGDPERLAAAFGAVRDAGARIVWHSAGHDVPNTLPPAVAALFEPSVGSAEDGIARHVAEDLGSGASEPLLAALDEKTRTPWATAWRERFAAVDWHFANTHDREAPAAAARDLAAGVPSSRWDAPTRRLLENYRTFGYRELQTTSPAMRRLGEDIRRVARSGVRRVLVTGESGVGKETVAQQLHVQSDRRGPFLAFNCATVARDLIESRLFGHSKGAFTDAKEDARGLFQEADEGTLFLDEIAELPLETQGVLLRALQEGRVQPVGAAREVVVDVRVVAATNRDLRALVRAGRFREDLYWRLSAVELVVPPLRDRPDDIVPLVRRLWRKFATPARRTLSRDDLAALAAYDWPGNVRQLGNVLERAALFDDRPIADLVAEERTRGSLSPAGPEAPTNPAPAAAPMHSPPAPASPAAPAPAPAAAPARGDVRDEGDETLATAVRAHIERVLARHDGNITAAARALGVSRGTLRRHLP